MGMHITVFNEYDSEEHNEYVKNTQDNINDDWSSIHYAEPTLIIEANDEFLDKCCFTDSSESCKCYNLGELEIFWDLLIYLSFFVIYCE